MRRTCQPYPMDHQTREEIEAHFAGPVSAAHTFLDLLKAGQFEQAWPLADPEWRLGRAQAWLWNNRAHPMMASLDLDEEARGAATLRGDIDWWPSFVESEAPRWAEAFKHFSSETWGAASRPRPVEVDYELVIFVETGGHVLHFTEETPVVGMPVLVHVIDARWLVAAVDSPRYQPGWPPTFVDGSPAVRAEATMPPASRDWTTSNLPTADPPSGYCEFSADIIGVLGQRVTDELRRAAPGPPRACSHLTGGAWWICGQHPDRGAVLRGLRQGPRRSPSPGRHVRRLRRHGRR